MAGCGGAAGPGVAGAQLARVPRPGRRPAGRAVADRGRAQRRLRAAAIEDAALRRPAPSVPTFSERQLAPAQTPPLRTTA